MPHTFVGQGVATAVDTLKVEDGRVMLSKEGVIETGAVIGPAEDETSVFVA